MKTTSARRFMTGLVLAIALLCAVAAADVTNNRKPKGLTHAMASGQESFRPSCTHPTFPVPAPSRPLGIDHQCGNEGSGGVEAVQNRAKNNFCAPGPAEEITIDKLRALQAAVERDKTINFGIKNTPDGHKKGPTINRDPLQNLGEGKLVFLKAFVFIARQEGGETVNCKTSVPDDPLFHDIHISLVDPQNRAKPKDTKPILVKKECGGVVAEMIPHHRPDDWTADNVEQVATKQVLVRVTGQLFFDSSHVPCSNGAGVGHNPKRSSLWEIHPIYKFELCTADCNGAGTWVPLDQWVKH